MKKIFFLLAFFAFGAHAQQIKFTTKTGGIQLKTANTSTSFIKVGSTVTNVATGATDGSFTYTVAVNSHTSAGVFDVSGSLVRTLWGNNAETPGVKKAWWDGRLDDGSAAPFPANYAIKVLVNNVQYNYDGSVGNSSDDLYGDYYHRGHGMVDICFAGAKGFYGLSYSEHNSAQKAISTLNAQKLINQPWYNTTLSSSAVCTDGNIIYWAGWTGNDGEQENYYVVGTYPADNGNADPSKTVQFANPVSISNFNGGQGAVGYPSIISATFNNTNGKITSMCVQKSGNFLFVARPGLNQLQVVDKRPSAGGATLQTLAYTNPASVACDGNGNLYMVYNNALHKFSVSATGTINDLGTSFTGLASPGFVDISPDNSTVAVSDNSTNQVKFYSVSGGNVTAVLGTGISYKTNPWAADNKFAGINFVKYQPDGSVWVGDPENRRYQRFNPDLTYKDGIAFIPFSRSATIDQNDATRIFSNYIEYQRDYSKPLAGTNGSWKFKANWQGNETGGDYSGLRDVVTLPANGRTYGTMCFGGVEVELTSTGLRKTGYVPTDPFYDRSNMGRDGTRFFPVNQNNDYISVYKRAITGFSVEGNPVRSAKALFVQTASGTANWYNPSTGTENNIGFTNSSDRYVFFNNMNPDDSQLGYHLGAVKPGSTKWLFKTSQSTRRNYTGNYPINGDFDTGNGDQHSENCRALIYDHDIFWNVNGEFYKQSEINIWNHFNDDGLLIGHFGAQGNGLNQPFAAGNAFGTGLSKNGNNYEIVWCDESVKGGVGMATVSNLNSIAEQTTAITVSAAIQGVPQPGDLMTGIPFNGTFTGGNGWTVEQPTTGLNMPTSKYLYRRDTIDLNISGSGTQTVKRTFNNIASLNSWTFSGGMGMQSGYWSDPNGNYNYLEVGDVSGKTITRFEAFVDPSQGYATYLRINGNITVAQGNVSNLYYPGLFGNFSDFNFTYVNGTLTFKLGGYSPVTVNSVVDIGADKTKPAFLRIRQGGGSNKVMDLYKLRFVPTAGLPQ